MIDFIIQVSSMRTCLPTLLVRWVHLVLAIPVLTTLMVFDKFVLEFAVDLLSVIWVSNGLMPSEQFFSHVMARTSYIWWNDQGRIQDLSLGGCE
jgi:hypothetical protein